MEVNHVKQENEKRANGEGTFYQRPDKTWIHQISLGRKEDGSPDRKSFMGKTRGVCVERREAYLADKAKTDALAVEEAAAFVERRRDGHSVESEILFNEAFMPWLKLYKYPPTKKATTYSSYLHTYETHFAEFFGEMRLFEITTDVVQEYYKLKQVDGSRKDGKAGCLSAKSIRNHHMLLKDFFRYALKKYRLEENPTTDTERPEVLTPDARVLDPDEMQIFMKEVVRETQRVAILFDLFMGLRVGELLAAEVSDIDVKARTIKISRNITRVNTAAIELTNPSIHPLNYNPLKKTHLIIQETPKTKDSNRVIPISDGVFALLAKHLYFLEQSNWPNPNNLLFPSTKGTHIDPKSFELRLKAVSKRCEIQKVNPHALRHTFATRLVEEHIPLTTVQRLLGHASVSTTERYVSTTTEEKRKGVDSISDNWSFSGLADAKKLSGAKKRMEFNDVRLPSWLQTEPEKAKT